MLDALAATQAAFEELSAGSSEAESTSPVDDSQEESPESPSQSATDASTTDSSSTADPATQGESTTEAPAQTGSAPVPEEKRQGPLPFERHKKILDDTRQEYENKLREREEKLQRIAWAEKVQGNPDQVAERLEAMRVAEEDPQRFVEFLLQDSRYSQILTQRLRPQPQLPAEDKDPMPVADKVYEDGTTGYTPERLKALLDWNARQTERRLSERLAPFEERDRAERTWNQTVARNATRLEDARQNWEGFKDHEAEIKAVIEDAIKRKDTSVTLEAAYRKVVVPKLKANAEELRKQVRAELIAESNRKSTAVTEVPGGTVAKPARDFRGMSMEDIVRATYEELAGK